MFDMATVIFFIYLHYLTATGYNVSVFDWICFFVIGVFQVMSWFIRIGILSSQDLTKDNKDTPKRLDDWFRN
tara:strand:+ start:1347 stop:1562 length:216 start_codon:yes stop_codon:yes gene_type:complete